MKVSFTLFVALAVVMIAGVAVLWWVLDTSGVFDQVSQSILTVTGTDNSSGNLPTGSFNVQTYISFGRVIGVTAVLLAVNTILLTALATLGVFLFNVATSLVGGVEVTLTEAD